MWPFLIGAIAAGLGGIVWSATRRGAEQTLGQTEFAAPPYTVVTVLASDQNVLLPVGRLLEVLAPAGGRVVDLVASGPGVTSVKNGAGQIVVTSITGPGNYDFAVWWVDVDGASHKTTVHLSVTATPTLPGATPVVTPTS